jgi:hypothetical protein
MSENDHEDDHEDDALLARLRADDPATDLPPADPTRVDRLLEGVMRETSTESSTETSTETGPRTRNPLTWLVAAAAVVLIAAGGVFAVVGGDDEEPPAPTAGSRHVTVALRLPAGAPARCMVPSADVLGRATYAADAEVSVVENGTATLEPSTWYAGDGTVLEVDAGSADLEALIGAPRFAEGQRYLVAADEQGQVMVCGFSGPYDDRLAQLYAEAFDR